MMQLSTTAALRRIQDTISVELRLSKGVEILFKARQDLEEERLYSQLENIGDALLRVALLRGLPADKPISRLDQLQSNNTLHEIAQRSKLGDCFFGSLSDGLETLFALVFEQEGYDKAIEVILELYRGKRLLPDRVDEAMNLRLVEDLASLVFRIYCRKIYPDTRGGGMNVRAKKLCKGAFLAFVLKTAFEGETSAKYAMLRMSHYEGFEFLQSRLESVLPTSAPELCSLVNKLQPSDVTHF